MTLSEKTKVQLTISSAIASIMGVASTVVAALMLIGVIPVPGTVVGQDCDTIKICSDERYITREKLHDNLKIFEKDIDYLKEGLKEQKQVNRDVREDMKEMKESLQTITNLLIQIKRDAN